MKLHYKLLDFIAYIPIFAVTDDKGFTSGSHEPEQSHEWYLSLVSILFGEYKIQFFSFRLKRGVEQTERRFIPFRIICLSDMEPFRLSVKKTEELESNYKEHYDELTREERKVEKEALLRHLSDEQSRIQTSYNKINAFTTIIVAVIPIVVTLVEWEKLKFMSPLMIVLFIILLYCYVNLCAWLIQAINVRSFLSSSFRDLKESGDKIKEYNWQIYFDWQYAKRSADMYVSFVRYIKIWVRAVIILTILFFGCRTFMPQTTVNSSIDSNNQVYTFYTDSDDKTCDSSADT